MAVFGNSLGVRGDTRGDKRTVPYIQGSALQSGFLSESDSKRKGWKAEIPNYCVWGVCVMRLCMQVLLTSGFGRNPDCNAEP